MNPIVADAKAIAKRDGLDGVIIIGFDMSVDKVGGASYGRTRRYCKAMGLGLDRLLANIEAGGDMWQAIDDSLRTTGGEA